MRLTDERVFQRFKNGASTSQIAADGRVGMTEAEVEAALNRAQDAAWLAAERGGYARDLLAARRARNYGTSGEKAGFELPDYPQRSIGTPTMDESNRGSAEERAVFLALRGTVAPTRSER